MPRKRRKGRSRSRTSTPPIPTRAGSTRWPTTSTRPRRPTATGTSRWSHSVDRPRPRMHGMTCWRRSTSTARWRPTRSPPLEPATPRRSRPTIRRAQTRRRNCWTRRRALTFPTARQSTAKLTAADLRPETVVRHRLGLGVLHLHRDHQEGDVGIAVVSGRAGGVRLDQHGIARTQREHVLAELDRQLAVEHDVELLDRLVAVAPGRVDARRRMRHTRLQHPQVDGHLLGAHRPGVAAEGTGLLARVIGSLAGAHDRVRLHRRQEYRRRWRFKPESTPAEQPPSGTVAVMERTTDIASFPDAHSANQVATLLRENGIECA